MLERQLDRRQARGRVDPTLRALDDPLRARRHPHARHRARDTRAARPRETPARDPRRSAPNKLVGLAVATVGAAIVIVSATGLTFIGERLVGDLLILGGAACWSVYAILGAINTRHGSPLGVTAVACLAGAAMLFPLGSSSTVTPTCPPGRFGASLALMVSYLVPIFALIQAVVILGEHPAPLEIVGGAIILVGVRIATLRFKPEAPPEEAAPA